VIGAVALSALKPDVQQQMQPNSTAAAKVAQQNLVSDLAQLKKDAKTLTKDTTVPAT
jgi:hypothetical protein